MKALGWAVGVLVVFLLAGAAWNREFRIGPGDRFGFWLWAGTGVFAALLVAGIMAADG